MATVAFNWRSYTDLLLFLATAGIVVPLFRRLHVSPVLGFLLAGAALGPFGLGRFAHSSPWVETFTLTDVEKTSTLAELGVVFLLFMIGLELSWERLARMRRLVFGLGSAQLVGSTVVLAALARFGFDLRVEPALIVGAALAMSSTAIVIPVLAESRRLNRAVGRTAFSVLLFQDLMVAPLLFLVALAGQRGIALEGVDLLWAFAPGVVGIAVLLIGGRLVLRPLFHLVAAAGTTELFVAACLFVVVSTSVITAAAGLSMGLGAFIAGLLLAETEFRREVEVTIDPFKGLLLGLFFVSTGASLDTSRIIAAPGRIIGFAVALIVLKAAVFYVAARLFRLRPSLAGEAALLLAPGGEFAFLMVGAAIAAHVVPAGGGADAMIAVTLTMFAIPLLGWIGRSLSPGLRRKDEEKAYAHLAPVGELGAEKILVVGYGRVGTLVGELLKRHEIPYVVIDGAAPLVAAARDKGVDIYWGDASRPDFLVRFGINRARGVVVTASNPDAVEKVVRAARGMRPDMTIVARARDADHATHLYEIGVTDAIPETIEASLQLAEALLVDIGVPMGYVIASIHEKREEYRKILQPQDGTPRRAIRRTTRLRPLAKKPLSARPEEKN
jgi:CPA2 family monovalent cation:H+ antiporter-2